MAANGTARELQPGRGMRRIAFIVLFTASLLAAAAAPKDFAGRWVATLKGTDICTIEIEDVGGKLAGASKFCHISVDQHGDLIEAGAPETDPPPSPFINPNIDGDTLNYEQSDGDGERMKFAFTLTSDGKADLQILAAPVAIKPIHFTRR